MIADIQGEILQIHRMGLLDLLLTDKTAEGAAKKAGGPARKHILWATDVYQSLGPEYRRSREIVPALITGERSGVIRTRARKALEQQTERTRKRAEVFTPLPVIRLMVSAADAVWFGRQHDRFDEERIPFTKEKTWKRYVDARRLEITCGEAPYLATRYDAATGEGLPLACRTGLLDRKLRAVSENAENEEEWLRWAFRALEATYGYEFSGDNVLIARVNLFMTFKEYLHARWQRDPTGREAQRAANIIAWNLWQMDGLTGRLPYCREDRYEETSLFAEGSPPEGAAAEEQPDCRIMDWRRGASRTFLHVNEGGRPMKFDFIIGNPPYQDGDSEASRKPPIYNLFMDAVYPLADRVELITPARFLFNAGQTPKVWNKKMLNDTHLKVLHYEVDGSKIFPNTDIKGGIAITYRDEKKNFGAIETFTSFAELNHILKKVKKKSQNFLDKIIFSQGLYRFSEKFFNDFPAASNRMGAGTGSKIISLMFDKIPEAFLAELPADRENYIWILGRAKGTRVYRYIKREYVIENPGIDTYNVLVPEANGSGAIGEVLSTPLIGAPLIGHTDTFLSIGSFKTAEEAEACLKYVKTKFARTMLGILKATQHNPPVVWQYVPLQDFTVASDIDWSQDVADIDRQLYAKYGLDEKEIDFIESHVKEMK